MAFVLDSDVFLQAKNSHYGFDFCPGFWEWIGAEHTAGRLYSIEKVRDELLDADIAAWAAAQPPAFFVGVDQAAQDLMPRVSGWATGMTQYTEGARNDFFSKADYFLVAQALAHGYTVVTHETPQPRSTNRIMIPDACAGVGVPCTNIFRLLRESGARFVLDSNR